MVLDSGVSVAPTAAAVVGTPLTDITMSTKAMSVVSVTSQCSYSSTIVHVPQPESGIYSNNPLICVAYLNVDDHHWKSVTEILIFVYILQKLQHWRMPQWAVSLLRPPRPPSVLHPAPPQKNDGLLALQRRCCLLTHRRRSKSMWIGSVIASFKAPTAPICS